MTMHDQLLPRQETRPNAYPSPLSNFSLRRSIADWIATAADYYTAAAVYERVSGLSDAELHRRGVSRATLAWDICQACDRANALR
jgi:hypothetical protein